MALPLCVKAKPWNGLGTNAFSYSGRPSAIDGRGERLIYLITLRSAGPDTVVCYSTAAKVVRT